MVRHGVAGQVELDPARCRQPAELHGCSRGRAQWFYSTVGNDQALDPFADEAVAEFLGRDIAGTWTSSKCPGGNLDRSIYTSPGDCYVAVVYYQGYKYLQNYRNTVGAADFWQGLSNYYNANKFKIGSTRKLLDALDAAANYHPNHAARFPSLYP